MWSPLSEMVWTGGLLQRFLMIYLMPIRYIIAGRLQCIQFSWISIKSVFSNRLLAKVTYLGELQDTESVTKKIYRLQHICACFLSLGRLYHLGQ